MRIEPLYGRDYCDQRNSPTIVTNLIIIAYHQHAFSVFKRCEGIQQSSKCLSVLGQPTTYSRLLFF